MTQHLSLYSEPFAATGNMHGKGFQRLLGRPALSLVQTAIREALQNCLDAASGHAPTEVLLRIRTLKPEEREHLRHTILGELPSSADSRSSICKALDKNVLRILEICDFNTRGLSGPTRADIALTDGEPQNFVNFLRNVGASRDVHLGGGTYGYGKTSFYALSSCSTIITDSQTTWHGRPTRRLMACHLGESFQANDKDGKPRHFTGRHWWGGEFIDGSLEPAVDQYAEDVANGLGMPLRSTFRSGTTIAIVDPLFESDEIHDIVDELTEVVLWNFWPRMIDSTPLPRKLKMTIEAEGDLRPLPRPEEFPPLDLFSRSLDNLRSGKDRQEILCGRPKRLLGHLTLSTGMAAHRIGPATREGSCIPKQAAHIALMRPAELVIKYMKGAPLPDPRYEWAGVFVCSDDDEVESAFADAEPPAHDDWIPSNLPKGNARTFVNVALTRLEEHANRYARPNPSPEVSMTGGPSLAKTATEMGRLLASTSGRGPGRTWRPPGRRSSRPRIAVHQPRFRQLDIGKDGSVLAIFEAELVNDGSKPGLRVLVEPYLVADGGRTDSGDLPPEYRVQLVSVELPSASLKTAFRELPVGLHSGVLRIVLRQPESAAAGVRATLLWDEPA